MIRVCIVEDQTLVREGLARLLSLAPDIEVIGEAADGDQARQLILRTSPDVVLLDVRMPRASGLEVLQSFQSGTNMPPCILLTTFDDDQVVLQGINLGAKGYLLKDVTLERLTDAIRRVAAGETIFSPTLTLRLIRELNPTLKRASQHTDEFLTDREEEVLRLMTGGYTNREIADALAISEGTVKNYVSSILSKLGVRDRTRAVLKAIQEGYL
ncbi:MAG: response regulator transcription factor [Terriglobia bacterium]|jgi:DNA-binding NarL/FixJ family response regulator|nr:response regulator transcription factor [Terriglobia bacterium]